MIFDWVENSWFSTLKMLVLYLPKTSVTMKSVVSESFSFGGDLLYFSLAVVVSEFALYYLSGKFITYPTI